VPDPLHQRIADDLRRKIESGELAPGTRLPSEPELAAQFDVGRNTVRSAVRSLTNRGLVQARRGQGTFVADKPEPFIITLSADVATGLGGGEGEAYHAEARAQGRQSTVGSPRVEITSADGRVAEDLKLPAGTALVTRHQERLIDGKPYSIQSSHYPMSLFERGAIKLTLASLILPGTVRYLEETLGFRQARYRDTISVRRPTESESAFFRPEDSDLLAVLEQRRVGFDDQGQPFRLAVSVFATNRNVFVAYAGPVPAQARLAGSLPAAGAEETTNA
jgi:GntR family transcriptional regulator